MALPVIDSSSPFIIPPQTIAALTYDKLAPVSIVIQTFDVNGPTTVHVEYVRYRILDDGVTREPAPQPSTIVIIKDILSLATTDQDLANAAQAIMIYVAKIAVENTI